MGGWQTATVSQWKRCQEIQHDTQHNNKRIMTLSIMVKWCYVECYSCQVAIMPSVVGNKPINRSVVMLSVVAPYVNSNKLRSQRTKSDAISKLLSGLNFAFLKSWKKGDCGFWIAVPVCQIQNLTKVTKLRDGLGLAKLQPTLATTGSRDKVQTLLNKLDR